MTKIERTIDDPWEVDSIIILNPPVKTKMCEIEHLGKRYACQIQDDWTPLLSCQWFAYDQAKRLNLNATYLAGKYTYHSSSTEIHHFWLNNAADLHRINKPAHIIIHDDKVDFYYTHGRVSDCNKGLYLDKSKISKLLED